MLTCVTCTTDVTSLGWGGVAEDVHVLRHMHNFTSLGWGGVGMLTFMLTTCTTDVTSLLGWGGDVNDVSVNAQLTSRTGLGWGGDERSC